MSPASTSPTGPAPPTATGVTLDDRVRAGDADTLYHAAGRWPGTRQWSIRSEAPSPLRIAGRLAEPGRIRWMLRGPVGLVGAVEVDGVMEGGTFADLSFTVTDEAGYRDAAGPALVFVVAGVFEAQPALRKLVVEAYADEIGDVAAYLGDSARLAGRLRDHVRRDPADGGPPFTDLLIYEVAARAAVEAEEPARAAVEAEEPARAAVEAEEPARAGGGSPAW